MEIARGEVSRVVLLDAKMGTSLLEYQETTYGRTSEPLGTAFSADVRLLFVDFPGSYKNPFQHVEVYAIDDVPVSNQRTPLLR